MRVRALDPVTGDMTWGRGQANFLVNSPAAVGQIVKTRLGLWVGDWFLNITEGTPYRTAVLGFRTDATRDPAMRARILGTNGVTAIATYASQLQRSTRAYTVQATITTAYGETLVSTSVPQPNQDVRVAR